MTEVSALGVPIVVRETMKIRHLMVAFYKEGFGVELVYGTFLLAWGEGRGILDWELSSVPNPTLNHPKP